MVELPSEFEKVKYQSTTSKPKKQKQDKKKQFPAFESSVPMKMGRF